MTVGTYTALGWRWRTVNGSTTAHLVPSHPGQLATSACGRMRLDGAVLVEVVSVFGDRSEIRCARCLDKDGTGGPQRDGRAEMGLGQ